ncbi:hypothetical protein B0H66DRAFT_559782 [Apodospora peruviana]|uniref:Uncharacterized protein n=1 Tax=Apodospora peruviana TaxID=516989 RepID=A0AAE0HZK6_9PEZI|nr:hypothetical protein B0H66DRAFT_559782 [Apodospora peruviana]
MREKKRNALLINNSGTMPETADVMVTSKDWTASVMVQTDPPIVDRERALWNLQQDGRKIESSINHDEIYQHCFAARDNLMRMVNKYRQKLKLPAVDSTAAHSWTEVETEVSTACSALENLASRDKDLSGSAGKLRRAFRGLCQHAGAGQTFVSLIPNDAFGFSSILCGSLKVIFTGLYQTAVYREEVYRALEDLPYILTDHAVHVNISLFNDDEELHRRTASLYVAVFKVLEHLLGWFVKNSFVTGVKHLMDPSGVSGRLKEKLAEVKLGSQRWDHHALKLSMQKQEEALQKQDEALRLQYWNSFMQDRMVRDVQTILNRTEGMEDRISRTGVLESLDPFVQVVVDALEKKLELSQTVRRRDNLLSFPDDTTRAEILDRLLYEPDLVVSDCEALAQLIRNRFAKTTLDSSRIAALQSNARLRAWLTIDESSLLLLNGRTRPQPVSETSVVSAQIMQRLLLWRDNNNPQMELSSSSSATVLAPLAFFCSRHRDWTRDPNASPAEAAMSLLLQLIDNRSIATLIPTDVLRECRDETVPEDVASICASLEKIILRCLDSSRVILVLVLDGLRFFAQPAERRDQMRELVEGLVGIYRRRSRTSATLKFLFASPTRSEFVEDLFDEDEILTLPRNIRKTAAAAGVGDGAGGLERLSLEFISTEDDEDGGL